MKRPTEHDLAELKGAFRAAATEPETPNVSAQLALQLVEEIDRLRTLIMDAAAEGGALFMLQAEMRLLAEGEIIRRERA